MKISKLILCVIAIGAITISGCKKDKESNTDKLTDKNWKLTASTVNPPINLGGPDITDWYAQMDACDQDDLTIFKDNGIVNFDTSTDHCIAGEAQTTSGTWAFNTDETVVTVTEPSGVRSFTLVSLSGSEMKVTSV